VRQVHGQAGSKKKVASIGRAYGGADRPAER
jgi:hypothetical protein